MNATTKVDTSTVSALHEAAAAADRLAACGVTVVHAYANGRRAVLIIDKPPVFVRGVIKRTHPDGAGGVQRIWAANFYSVQLEWLENVPQGQAVRHG